MANSRQHFAVNLVVCLLLGGAVWATFGRAVGGQFFFDDEPAFEKNESIRQLWPLSVPLSPPREHPFSARPLVNLSAAVNYHFGGLDPSGYRLVNMALHLFSALLLYGIVGRTLRLNYFPPWLPHGAAGYWITTALAFAVALVWTVHPLQTETVCYVTQRTELMVGLFYLATLYASIRYWLAETPVAKSLWLLLAVVACAAGMASKEVMVSAPLVVLLYQWTFLTRGNDAGKQLRASWPLYAGLCLTWILLVYLIADTPRQASAGFSLGVPILGVWLTQANVALVYLKLAFWPWPLFIYYDMGFVQSIEEALPALLIVAALGIGTLVALWHRWAVGFLGAWFFIILSPTSLVPIISEVAAERRMYLPLAAIVALVIVGGYWLALRVARRQQVAAVGVLLAAAGMAAVLAAVSHHRLAVYQSEVALWSDLLERQPESDLVRFCLAYAMEKAERHEEAASFYAEALRMNPGNPNFLFVSAKNLRTLGRHAEAIAQLEQALSSFPQFPEAHLDLALMYQESGDAQKAAEHFAEAARQQPQSADNRLHHAKALQAIGQHREAVAEFEAAFQMQPADAASRAQYADALRMSGEPLEAVSHYRQAIEKQPDLAVAYWGLAQAYADLGRQAEAIDQYEQFLERDPGHAATHAALGKLLLETGEFSRAVEHLQTAAKLLPNDSDVRDDYGMALLEIGRTDEAIAELEAAVRLAPDSPTTSFHLAEALADAGRDDEALVQARRALALARAQRDKTLIERIEIWLAARQSSQ